jgi:hypothetical protein
VAERSNAPRRRSQAVAFERPTSEADWKKALGRKVSLRYRLRDDPEHPFSEAIGYVQSVVTESDKSVVAIVNKRGETTSIAIDDIEAAKLFPL